MEKFLYTLFQTSYASGNFMLVWMPHNRGPGSVIMCCCWALWRNQRILLHLYPDLHFRWDEVTSSLVIPDVWLFKTCLFETHSEHYKSQKIDKKTNRPKHLLNLRTPYNDITGSDLAQAMACCPVPQPSISKITLKMTEKNHSNLPGGNELIT